MKNFSTKELIQELSSRGYETFDRKQYAIEENMWTLDDAIDSYNEVKEKNFTHDELSHDKLMEILNKTISSSYIVEEISEKLYKNIYENLFEN